MLLLTLLGGWWRAALAFLSKVPWQVWLALALGLAFLYYGHVKDKQGYARAEAHYQSHFAELERQRDEATKAVQAAILAHAKALQALRDEQERLLQEAEKKRLADLANLRRRLTINVTTENTRSCPDVPVSYLRLRVDAAAHANGVDRPEPAGTPAEPEPETSGVSLPELAETDIAQADAFRQAVTWGEGWRDYALGTKQACEAAFAILTEKK